MERWLFSTPDGFGDLQTEACAAKRQLENRLRAVFAAHGFDEIETPGVEFFDVYSGGSGAVEPEKLFKFFDERGRILCLRYDGTVPAARLAATTARDRVPPLRFSYVNPMYRWQSSAGLPREITQAGVELLGVRSAIADAEIIATAIAAAQACGVEGLRVALGQVAFFASLLNTWTLPAEEAKQLPLWIDNKDRLALEQMAGRLDLKDADRQILGILAGGVTADPLEQIDRLSGLVDVTEARAALDDLRAILEILNDFGLSESIALDLGMVSEMHYYTGMIFKGFTAGLGSPILAGGRYDRLLAHFGRDLPATGFSLGITATLQALRRQDRLPTERPRRLLLGCSGPGRQVLWSTAETLRAQGWQVIVDCQGLDTEALAGQTIDGLNAAVIDVDGSLRWLDAAGEQP